MGFECENLIKEYLPTLSVKIIRIKHYGFRYKSEDAVFLEISESLDKMKEEYINGCKPDERLEKLKKLGLLK